MTSNTSSISTSLVLKDPGVDAGVEERIPTIYFFFFDKEASPLEEVNLFLRVDLKEISLIAIKPSKRCQSSKKRKKREEINHTLRTHRADPNII